MPVEQITSRNVNGAFHSAWWRFRTSAVQENSRNGPVLVMADPVMTTYMRPQERVLFNATRDANPVFHLVESLWMLAGESDVKYLLPFNSKYDQYAEPDGHVHGAYGKRWRNWFNPDQILMIIRILRLDPQSRQAVMQMWDCDADLGANVKDKPCNTHIYFDGRQGRLNMTVCCRSNDMLWGAYGANVVHFSMLQELIAWGTDLAIGEYRQYSNNFHVYTEVPMVKKFLAEPPPHDDRYADDSRMSITPMFHPGETVKDFLYDCEALFNAESFDANTQFFNKEVLPLVRAYLSRKRGESEPIVATTSDWNIAYREWVGRRDHND